MLDGKDKGRRGIVKLVLRPYNSVVVEGINLAKKNVKSTPEHKGGMYTKEQKIEVSKVSHSTPGAVEYFCAIKFATIKRRSSNYL